MEKRGDGRTYPPEHHPSGWKPDAALVPIELPPLSNHIFPHSLSASPGLSLWLLSALTASASQLRSSCDLYSSVQLFFSRCHRCSCSHSSCLQCQGLSWPFVGSWQCRYVGRSLSLGALTRLSFGLNYARRGDRKRGREQKERAGDRC